MKEVCFLWKDMLVCLMGWFVYLKCDFCKYFGGIWFYMRVV